MLRYCNVRNHDLARGFPTRAWFYKKKYAIGWLSRTRPFSKVVVVVATAAAAVAAAGGGGDGHAAAAVRKTKNQIKNYCF